MLRLLPALLLLVMLPAEARLTRLDPLLQTALATADPDQLLQAVVVFEGATPPSDAQMAPLAALGLTGFRFRQLPMAGVAGTPEQLRGLLGVPGLRSVWLNQELRYFNERDTRLTGVQRLRADERLRNAEGLPFTGRGVTVLVNDSGIDGTHPDLRFGANLVQNVTAITNPAAYGAILSDPDIANLLPLPVELPNLLPVFVAENIPNTDSTTSHGTHVAGIVGGTGAASGGKYAGVAPGANLIGYGSGAVILVLDGLGGFDWAIENQARYNIRVINNSFGSPSDVGTPFDPEHPFAIASKMASDAGIIVVFAAGNFFDESSIGGSWQKAPWIITAAASTPEGRLADFSSRGRFGGRPQPVTVDGETFFWEDRPTITAPGSAVVSTRATSLDPVLLTGTVDLEGVLALDPDRLLTLPPEEAARYVVFSGTSMAAPHTAGVIALMLEANPALTWREVKAILERTATPMPGYGAWEVGAGLIDAHAAVAMAQDLARDYGGTLPLLAAGHAERDYRLEELLETTVTYLPVGGTSAVPFVVNDGVALVQSWIRNSVGVATTHLLDPDGTRHTSHNTLPTLALQMQQVATFAPGKPGGWQATLEPFLLPDFGVRPTVPDTFIVRVQQFSAAPRAGMADLEGHPLADEAERALRRGLLDGVAAGRFAPDAAASRADLAFALVRAGGLRQAPALPGARVFADVPAALRPYVAAASEPGAALLDPSLAAPPVIETAGARFEPDAPATRLALAVGAVRALGREAEALSTAAPDVADAAEIPADFRGHAALALSLGLLEARNGAFDPEGGLSRAELAEAANRLFALWRAGAREFFPPVTVPAGADELRGPGLGGTQGLVQGSGALSLALLGGLVMLGVWRRRVAARR